MRLFLLIAVLACHAWGKGGSGGAAGYSYTSRTATRSYTSRNVMLAGGATGVYVYSSRGTRYNGGRYRTAVASDNGLFECKNGVKIVDSYICDRIDDCGDASDEMSPTPCQGKCSGGEQAMHIMFLLGFIVWIVIARMASKTHRNIPGFQSFIHPNNVTAA